MDGVDELFEVKNFYYIGAFQQCINAAANVKTSSDEKNFYVYRSYIGQKKFRVVLDEIVANNESILLPVRHMAEYFSRPEAKSEIVETFEGIMKNAVPVDDYWRICGATLFYHEGLYEYALSILNEGTSLECLAITLQCLIRMRRLDLAKKTLVSMQEKDDDATLTQLACAWVNIETNGEKLQDAYYIFQELADKYLPTPLLLNGQAVCHIGQGRYEEAEAAARECLEKSSDNYEALVNLLVISQQTEKGEDAAKRYLLQLKDAHPNSELIRELQQKDEEFERVCLLYSASVPTPAELQ